jgi:hypothetical protein
LRNTMRLSVLKLSGLVLASSRVFLPSQRKPRAAATDVFVQ